MSTCSCTVAGDLTEVSSCAKNSGKSAGANFRDANKGCAARGTSLDQDKNVIRVFCPLERFRTQNSEKHGPFSASIRLLAAEPRRAVGRDGYDWAYAYIAGKPNLVRDFLRESLDKLPTAFILSLNPPPSRDCTGDVDRIWEGSTTPKPGVP